MINLIVDARDRRLGLANVSATLAGVAVAAIQFGQGFCTELSPSDTTTDLPLPRTVPRPTVSRCSWTPRRSPTGSPAPGHRDRRRGERDGPDFDLKVVNHPPVVVPTPGPAPRHPVPIGAHADADAGAGEERRRPEGPQALLGLARRLIEGRRQLPPPPRPPVAS